MVTCLRARPGLVCTSGMAGGEVHDLVNATHGIIAGPQTMAIGVTGGGQVDALPGTMDKTNKQTQVNIETKGKQIIYVIK